MVSFQDLIKRQQAGGFIGRGDHLARFDENLRLPLEDPRRRLLFTVHGNAGVGKSFLANQFIRLSREAGRLTGYVDESSVDLAGALGAIARDFASQDARCKNLSDRLDAYRKRQEQLDPELRDELASLLTKGTVRLGLKAAQDIPVVGGMLGILDDKAAAEKTDKLRAQVTRKIRDRQDVRLVLSPVEELTKAFLQDLALLAKRKPVSLFLDTFERTGTFLEPWLLDLFAGRFGELPADLIITVSGQHALNVNVWGPYLGVRQDIPLDVFTSVEARQLLATRGITDEEIVTVLLSLSGRLPVWLAMLAESGPVNRDEVGDASGDVVERFLKWVPDQRLRNAALWGALPRKLDQDVFAVASGSESPAEDFAWLRAQPFVSERADGWRYHEVVRSAMIRVQRRVSLSDYYERHRKLADYFDTRSQQSGAFFRDAIDERYHSFSAGDDPQATSLIRLLCLIAAVETDLIRQATATLEQAGRDNDLPVVEQHGAQLNALAADQVHGQLSLLTELLKDDVLQAVHRGLAHSALARHFVDQDQPEAALPHLGAAIRWRPDEPVEHFRRGVVLAKLKRHEEALTDFTRAVELEPDEVIPLYFRGMAHRELDNLVEAELDLGHAVHLAPDDAYYLEIHADLLITLGQPQKALVDLDRAVELAPDDGWIWQSRAFAQLLVGAVPEAATAIAKARSMDADDQESRLLQALVDVAEQRETEHFAALLDDPEVPNLIRSVCMAGLNRNAEAEELLRSRLENTARPQVLITARQYFELLQRYTGQDMSTYIELLQAKLDSSA
ncbi:tetratricopeptide repeat protein [Pseudonocardiaceae bacterium YIM PH 21723]|nr:tetratricopeptide repeat protein [Pseudonocardiaceae bacterium YIM PH 21723]